MRVGPIEITRRESAISLVIVILLLSVSLLIYGNFKERYDDERARFNLALLVEDQETFNHVWKTGIGDVFTFFNIEADDEVRLPELNESWLLVEKVREDYTMHTVTSTDSKGNVTTSTYWSWDYYGEDSFTSKNVVFNGLKLPSGTFSNWGSKTLKITDKNFVSSNPNRLYKRGFGDSTYLYKNGSTRFYYKVVPTKISGSLFASFGANSFKDQDPVKIYRDLSPSQLRDKLKSDNEGFTFRFFAYAIFLILLVAAVFVSFENRWLNK